MVRMTYGASFADGPIPTPAWISNVIPKGSDSLKKPGSYGHQKLLDLSTEKFDDMSLDNNRARFDKMYVDSSKFRVDDLKATIDITKKKIDTIKEKIDNFKERMDTKKKESEKSPQKSHKPPKKVQKTKERKKLDSGSIGSTVRSSHGNHKHRSTEPKPRNSKGKSSSNAKERTEPFRPPAKIGNLFQANCYVDFCYLPRITLQNIYHELGPELSAKSIQIMKAMSIADWDALEKLYYLIKRATKADQLIVSEFAVALVRDMKGVIESGNILEKIHPDISEAGFLLGKAILSVFHGYRSTWGNEKLIYRIMKTLKNSHG